MDEFVPIMGTRETLLFLNPKVVLDDNDTNEENVGIGLRQLLFDDNLILGANFFYDTRLSENKNRFHQLGFGLEALHEWLDLRTNFYFSLSDEKPIGDDTSFRFGQRSLIRVTTTHMEEPLSGLDYEAGVLIPFLSDIIETRAYMGGSHYFSDLGEDINGIKGRFEIRPTPLLTVDLEIKDDNVSSPHFFVGGYVTIPFSTATKNPFEGCKDIFNFGKGPRPTRERMTDLVIRDIDIISESASQSVEQKEHDLTYVDNSNASGTEDGSLEHPYTTLQDGNDHAIGDNWVYVKQGNADYVENVVLADNITLWGAGYDGGFAGIPATGYPVVDGNALDNTITLANNNTVMGLQIQNSSAGGWTDAGIYGLNVNAANINHNNITDNAGNSICLEFTDDATHSDFTFTGNTITENDYYGIYVYDEGAGTVSDFTFSGNTITGNDDGGIFLYNCGAGTVSGFTFSGNTITGNDYYGIWMGNGADGTISDFTFTDNTITGNTTDGISVGNWDVGTISDFTFTNNTFTGNGYSGIYVGNNCGTISDFTFTSNTITGNSYAGVYLPNTHTCTTSGFTFTNNIITGNGEYGIEFYNNAKDVCSSFSDFTFTGNTIAGNSYDGIYMYSVYNGSTISDFTFTGNTITENTRSGIWFEKGGGTISSMNVGNGTTGGSNSIYDNGDGITYFDIKNDSGVDDLPAQYNWWGTATPQASQFGGDNSVDYTNPLSSDPN